MRKKVAILGANSTRIYAPLDDPEWEIWGCNSLWSAAMNAQGEFKATRWFEMHPMSVQTAAELKAIETCTVPIYTLEDESKWAKNSIVYPMHDIHFFCHGWRYFTCTFAYQIALAIHERFEEIGLYGVELWQGTPRERLVERACVEFWIGIAIGRDITVSIPRPQSRLANQRPLYGYDYHDEMNYVNKYVDATVYGYLQELEQSEQRDIISSHIAEGHS